MLPPDDRAPLQHMLEYAQKALRITKSRIRSDLDIDEELELALTRAVEVIGEASNRVSRATQDAANDIPWLDIKDMRNRLIHGYDDVDRNVLWKTIEDDLPPLIAQLERILNEPPASPLAPPAHS